MNGKKVVIILDGERIELSPEAGKSILDQLIDEGYDPPYSCTSGVCSTCMAKIIKGAVEMEACYALDEEEVEQGFILTCQSHPVTDHLELTYDDL